MNLADYQKEIVNQIYQLLVEDENKAITLHGDVGCGKSTIAQGIVELLQEDWTVFWLEGIDQCLAPYLTWHIGTKIYSKKNLELGAEIAFGVNFLPSPVSLEFGVMAQYSKQNLILTPSEEALVEGIRKRASGNHNILFVADNYELWDIPSRQLLEKLMFLPLNLLTDFHLVTLFISREKFSTNKMVSVIDIPIGKISDDDIIPSLTLVKVKIGYRSSNNAVCSHVLFGNGLCYFFTSSVLVLFIMLRMADLEINS